MIKVNCSKLRENVENILINLENSINELFSKIGIYNFKKVFVNSNEIFEIFLINHLNDEKDLIKLKSYIDNYTILLFNSFVQLNKMIKLLENSHLKKINFYTGQKILSQMKRQFEVAVCVMQDMILSSIEDKKLKKYFPKILNQEYLIKNINTEFLNIRKCFNKINTLFQNYKLKQQKLCY